MTRLLEDLQTSKPCPDDSVSRLNRELEQVQAIINSRQQARYSSAIQIFIEDFLFNI